MATAAAEASAAAGAAGVEDSSSSASQRGRMKGTAIILARPGHAAIESRENHPTARSQAADL